MSFRYSFAWPGMEERLADAEEAAETNGTPELGRRARELVQDRNRARSSRSAAGFFEDVEHEIY